MKKIAIFETNSPENKGSMARLEGMIECLKHEIPNCQITIFHRYYSTKSHEFERLCGKFSEIEFEAHPWFKEKNTYLMTSISFIILFTFYYIVYTIFPKTKYSSDFRQFDAIVDINFIEPEKHTDKRSIVNTIGTSFIILSLLNILKLNTPVIISSSTIGPYENKILVKLAKMGFNRSSLITFREEYSEKYVKSIGVTSPMELTADLAFLMNLDGSDEALNMIKVNDIYPENDLIIGITPAAMMNSLIDEQDYINLILELEKYLIEKFNAKILLIANTYQDVDLTKKILFKSDKKNVSLIPFEISAISTKSILKSCDFFICSRFHALVASTSLNVPSLGIVTYSFNKFHGILGNMMNMENYLLDIEDSFNYDEFLDNLKLKVDQMIENREKITKELDKQREITISNAYLNGKLINELLNHEKGLK